MKTMFGIELNDIQYAELEFVQKCLDSGKHPRAEVTKRVDANLDLVAVYKELADKGLLVGVKAWGMYLCDGLTSTGKRFIPELKAFEAEQKEARKMTKRNIWIGHVVSFVIGVASTVIAGVILSFLT